MILAAGYDLFRALRSTANRQKRALALSHKAAGVLEQIRSDLLHATVISDDSDKAVFTGDNPILNTGKITLFEFNSLCAGGRPDKICGARQIHRIKYELIKENDSICLYRLAVPMVGKNKSDDNNDNKKLIFNKIEQIKILFYNGKNLMPSFSSKLNLPVYVKLELAAEGQSWPLTVKLPCGAAETESL